MSSTPRSVAGFIACGIGAALVLGYGGCGAGDSTDSIVIETRPDGVEVVRNPDRGLWRAGEVWEIEEVLRIGVMDGEEPYIFGSIRDVRIGTEGRIYVLDGNARQVRIFDADGRHLRSVGRQGAGPGEFQMPLRMAWAPDGNLWIVDVSNNRLTVLSPDGDLLATYRRQTVGYSATWKGAFARDGSLFEPKFSTDPNTGESIRVYIRQELQNGELVETGSFDLPQFDKQFYQVNFQGGSFNIGIPFAPELSWVFDGDAGIWVATGEHYRIRHQTMEGETTRIVELAREPAPVTNQDRVSAREDIQQILDRMRITGGLDQIDFSRIPGHKPAHGPIMLDDEGRIWVVQTPVESVNIDEGRPPTIFDVFDPEGRYLGPLAVDVALMPPPAIAAGHIAGIIREESGLQRVVVYRIQGYSNPSTAGIIR